MYAAFVDAVVVAEPVPDDPEPVEPLLPAAAAPPSSAGVSSEPSALYERSCPPMPRYLPLTASTRSLTVPGVLSGAVSRGAHAGLPVTEPTMTGLTHCLSLKT